MEQNFKPVKANYRNGDLTKQWFVEYQFLHPETLKFERIREYISLKHKTKNKRFEVAQKKIKQLTAKLQSGWSPFEKDDPRQMTVWKAVDMIVEIKNSTTDRKRTITTNKNIRSLFFEFLKKNNFTQISLQNFNYQHAVAFMDYCLLNKKYSNRTYNNKLEQIRNIFNLLFERDYIDVNHFKKFKKLKTAEPALAAYSLNDLNLIKDHLPSYNFSLFVIAKLVFHNYIRLTEMTRLQVKDIDFEKQQIIITPDKGKNRQLKYLPIYQDVNDLLKQQGIENLPENHYVFSSGLKPGITQISTTRIHEKWKLFCETYKIKNRGIYKLKHTGNGMSLDNGAAFYDIFLMNRHSDINMTKRYIERYRQVVPNEHLVKFATFGNINNQSQK